MSCAAAHGRVKEMNAFEPRDVRAHVDRIAGSPMFAESERLRRFLRFTVESKLEGNEGRVKEYALGREVFDRKDGYDPRLDPIVRVEARRLRSKLRDYYEGPGSSEVLRIEYPKGGYLPVFSNAAEGASPQRRRHGLALAAGVLFVIVGVALCAVAYRALASKPSGMVAILPAQWVWARQPIADASAIGLSELLDEELANRRIARVIAWPLIVEQRQDGKSIRETSAELHASRIVAILVRPVDNVKLVTVFLLDPSSGEKLLAQQYVVTDLSSHWMQQGLARRIAMDLGSSGRL